MGKDLKGRDIGKGFCQRKDGVYTARYVNAYGKRVSLYDTDLKGLQKQYHDKMYELDHHLNSIDDNISVDEWYEKWLTVYKMNTVRESTLRLYKDIYQRMISPTLGRLKLNSVRKIHVQNLVNELHDKKGYSWEVLDKVRRILNDMYGRAIEDDFALKNPTKGVRIPAKKSDGYHVLNTDEQALFFETAAGTYYDNMFNVAVNTGLRPGELFALTRDDLDMKNKVIHVTKTLLYAKFDGESHKSFRIGPPKTKTSVRDVPINSTCEKYLFRQFTLKNMISKKFPKEDEFADLLFVTKHNTPINVQIFNDAIRRIIDLRNEMMDEFEQLPVFGGHTFRHTFATRCLEAGVKPKTIQSYLGHATLEMTMNLYVHTMDSVKQEEIELLEQNINALRSSDYIDSALQKAAGSNNIVKMPNIQ
ncbi:MAG: tyrosine-type recombinase/integrase [Eubacterium sp.]|nr:tyrosine-type recombinase/integrase [Eubacterium sp.]